VAVFLIDLNGFKQVNDQHGHEVGDQLLVAVGQRLQTLLHTSDLVARLGGDEFVVMCTGLQHAEQAERLAERLSGAFDAPFDLPERLRCSVGLTLGHTLAPQDGTDAATLIKGADAAMYRGKSARQAAATAPRLSTSP
jgi:diguanylate cyclase (GGDEF)-like protein